MKPSNSKDNIRTSPFASPEGTVVTPATLESVPGAISTLQSAAEFFNKYKDVPVITPELIEDIGEVSTLCDALSARLGKLKANLKSAAGASVKKPVTVYRYVDKDDKEGFVIDDGTAEAENKARMLDADKQIEHGYAYRDEKDPNKFTGFVPFKAPDGADVGKY